MSSVSWLTLVEEYLSARRGLGFALQTPAYLLRDFARYADTVGHHGPLTIELAVHWARGSRSDSSAQAIRRLGAVRQALLDPATEIPQGTQATRSAAVEEHRQTATCVATTDRPKPRRPGVPEPRWQTDNALRDRAPPQPRSPNRVQTLPFPRRTSDLTSHNQAHDRDAPPPVRRRHHRHRPVVGA
jgi:hypothetical protein